MHAVLKAAVGVQVITAAEFHPQSCHVFAYSSSKGSVRLADQRASALCEQRAKAFVMPEQTVSQYSAFWVLWWAEQPCRDMQSHAISVLKQILMSLICSVA